MELDFFLPKNKERHDLDEEGDDAWHEFIKEHIPEVFWNPEVREKTEKGGKGSGNWGHGGLAGVHGGSSPTKTSGGFTSSPSSGTYFPKDWLSPDENAKKAIETMKKMGGVDNETGFMVSGVVDYEEAFNQKQVRFTGTVYVGDKDIGDIKVIYRPGNANGEIMEIMLENEAQGTGFGKRYISHVEDTLVEMGARELTVTAAASVGGYFWAKLGYDFRGGDGRENAQRVLKNKWNKRYPFEKIPSEVMSPRVKAWELAALRGHDGYKIGRDAMLGLSWFGAKASPGNRFFYSGNEIDDTGYDIGKMYYNL